ncbi:MAG: hypothetical protein M3075_13155 [Candidatus Dormibacteraeota bacterium]|nr:hypothetical protein [Candidatus Dormibacteraeota bacterium]
MNRVQRSRAGRVLHSEELDEPDEPQIQVGLKDTCIVVGAFSASILVSGLLFIAMLWSFQTLAR